MLVRILAGAGVLALAVVLLVLFGNAREHSGELAERAVWLAKDVAAAKAVGDVRAAAADHEARAIAAWADRFAAQKPIILTSHDTVTRYAETPAGAALCLGADRVHGIDGFDAQLFPAAAPAAGGSPATVPADAGASPARR